VLRHIVKLSKNGNAVTVVIPQRFLTFNRWEAGTYVGVELQDDGSLVVRKPRTEDFVGSAPKAAAPAELSHVEPQDTR
jgi:antitoxin component of MazEF toxin-antitoxin module